MNNLNQLKEAAFEVIDDEGLPQPESIKYTDRACRTRGGVCYRRIKDNLTKYRITIETTRAVYYPDPAGKYRRNDGVRVRKGTYGENKDFRTIKQTMAHEIAHLKFFDHSPSHYAYTNHIRMMIDKKLEACQNAN